MVPFLVGFWFNRGMEVSSGKRRLALIFSLVPIFWCWVLRGGYTLFHLREYLHIDPKDR